VPHTLARGLNVAALLALSGVLAFAFWDQFVGGALPCPLCILQRAAFCAVGAGIALNVERGPSARGYGLAILGALAGGAIALRQIALHIVPGTGAYGPPVLGLHLYTWAFVLFAAVVLGCAAMLVLHREGPAGGRAGVAGSLAVALFLALSLGNGAATLAECGTGLCPDDPSGYDGLRDLREWLAPAPAPTPAPAQTAP
jgi:disulfide bond formation protein DsbB